MSNTDIKVKTDIKQILDSEALQRSLEKSFSSESKRVAFRTSVLSLVNSNPKIAECEPLSVINACLQASTLDLPINQNLGFAYIIPYSGKEGLQAQFQMGYKGFRQLAIRTGQFKNINTTDVKVGELKSFDRLSGSIEFEWVQEEKERNQLETIGFVAYFKLVSGLEDTLYMTIEELERHAKRYSQQYKSDKAWVRNQSKWVTDFDAMAKKTVLKLLLSRSAPLSVEMQQAIVADQAVIGSDKQDYIDNKESLQELNWQKQQDRIREWINNAKTLEQLEQVKQFDDGNVSEDLINLYAEKEAGLKAEMLNGKSS